MVPSGSLVVPSGSLVLLSGSLVLLEPFILVQEEGLLLAQEEDLLLAQEDKEGSPEKLKMVKKHFFLELFGDLWGVICYHHWYPRAGLEAPEKTYFSKKVLRLKKMQNYPLSIFHVAVRPESLPGADFSTFEKVIVSLFSGLFGPFRAHFF